MMPTIRIIVVIICLTSMGLISCRKNSVVSGGPASETLLNNLQNNYSFSLFYYALHKTGLDNQLSGTNTHTLLIPDNDAFAKDSIFTTADLDTINTDSLKKWMTFHVLPGSIRVTDVPQAVNTLYPDISGGAHYFSRPIPGNYGNAVKKDFDHTLHVNGDTVNSPDIIASDGVIQVMNRPLKLPEASVQAYLSANSQYSALVTCLQHFGLWDQLAGPGPFTVFAPENASFVDIRVSPDSLNRLDTVLFKTSLFSIYIVNQTRIFLTDFSDIPPANVNSPGVYITPSGSYNYTNGSLSGGGVDPISNQPVPPGHWTAPDIITLNGVVHGMHGVLLTPGQAKK